VTSVIRVLSVRVVIGDTGRVVGNVLQEVHLVGRSNEVFVCAFYVRAMRGVNRRTPRALPF